MPQSSLRCPPVLLIAFNRPEATARVFEAIRAAQPHKLYAAFDGPRSAHPEDNWRIEASHAVLDRVDWNCKLSISRSPKNRGCTGAVKTAIDWFFEHEPQGIILEDDCLPHPEFFNYCAYHLKMLEQDTSIATIAGTRFLSYSLKKTGSGERSRFFTCWGWASWRLTWQRLQAHTQVSLQAQQLANIPPTTISYYERLEAKCLKPNESSWDYKVTLSCLQLGLQHVIPPTNLILNLGFSKESTHTEKPPPHAPMHFGSSACIDLSKPVDEIDTQAEIEFVRTQFQALPHRLFNRLRYTWRRITHN